MAAKKAKATITLELKSEKYTKAITAAGKGLTAFRNNAKLTLKSFAAIQKELAKTETSFSDLAKVSEKTDFADFNRGLDHLYDELTTIQNTLSTTGTAFDSLSEAAKATELTILASQLKDAGSSFDVIITKAESAESVLQQIVKYLKTAGEKFESFGGKVRKAANSLCGTLKEKTEKANTALIALVSTTDDTAKKFDDLDSATKSTNSALDATTSATEKSQGAFNNLTKSIDDQQKVVNELGSKLKQARSEFDDTQSALADLDSAGKSNTTTYRELEGVLEKNAERYQELKDKTSKAEAELKTLNDTNGKTAKSMKSLGKDVRDTANSLCGTLTSKSKAARTELDALHSTTTKVESGFNQVDRKTTDVISKFKSLETEANASVDALDKVSDSSKFSAGSMFSFGSSIKDIAEKLGGLSDQIFGFQEKLVALERSKLGLKQTTVDLERAEEDYIEALASGTLSAKELKRMEEDLLLLREDHKIEIKEVEAEQMALNSEFVNFGITLASTTAQIYTTISAHKLLQIQTIGTGKGISWWTAINYKLRNSLTALKKAMMGVTAAQLKMMLPIGVAIGLWLAWESNLFGFRDAMNTVIDTLGTAIDYLKWFVPPLLAIDLAMQHFTGKTIKESAHAFTDFEESVRGTEEQVGILDDITRGMDDTMGKLMGTTQDAEAEQDDYLSTLKGGIDPLKTITGETDSYSTALDTVAKYSEEAVSQTEQLENELVDAQTVIANTAAEITKAEKELDQYNDAQTRTSPAAKELRDKIAALKSQMDAAEKSTGKIKDAMTKLRIETYDTAKGMDSLTKHIDALGKGYLKNDKSLSGLNSTLEEQQQNLIDVRREIWDVQQKMDALDRTTKEGRDAWNGYNDRLTELNRLAEIGQRRINDLTGEVNDLTEAQKQQAAEEAALAQYQQDLRDGQIEGTIQYYNRLESEGKNWIDEYKRQVEIFGADSKQVNEWLEKNGDRFIETTKQMEDAEMHGSLKTVLDMAKDLAKEGGEAFTKFANTLLEKYGIIIEETGEVKTTMEDLFDAIKDGSVTAREALNALNLEIKDIEANGINAYNAVQKLGFAGAYSLYGTGGSQGGFRSGYMRDIPQLMGRDIKIGGQTEAEQFLQNNSKFWSMGGRWENLLFDPEGAEDLAFISEDEHRQRVIENRDSFWDAITAKTRHRSYTNKEILELAKQRFERTGEKGWFKKVRYGPRYRQEKLQWYGNDNKFDSMNYLYDTEHSDAHIDQVTQEEVAKTNQARENNPLLQFFKTLGLDDIDSTDQYAVTQAILEHIPHVVKEFADGFLGHVTGTRLGPDGHILELDGKEYGADVDINKVGGMEIIESIKNITDEAGNIIEGLSFDNFHGWQFGGVSYGSGKLGFGKALAAVTAAQEETTDETEDGNDLIEDGFDQSDENQNETNTALDQGFDLTNKTLESMNKAEKEQFGSLMTAQEILAQRGQDLVEEEKNVQDKIDELLAQGESEDTPAVKALIDQRDAIRKRITENTQDGKDIKAKIDALIAEVQKRIPEPEPEKEPQLTSELIEDMHGFGMTLPELIQEKLDLEEKIKFAKDNKHPHDTYVRFEKELEDIDALIHAWNTVGRIVDIDPNDVDGFTKALDDLPNLLRKAEGALTTFGTEAAAKLVDMFRKVFEDFELEQPFSSLQPEHQEMTTYEEGKFDTYQMHNETWLKTIEGLEKRVENAKRYGAENTQELVVELHDQIDAYKRWFLEVFLPIFPDAADDFPERFDPISTNPNPSPTKDPLIQDPNQRDLSPNKDVVITQTPDTTFDVSTPEGSPLATTVTNEDPLATTVTNPDPFETLVTNEDPIAATIKNEKPIPTQDARSESIDMHSKNIDANTKETNKILLRMEAKLNIPAEATTPNLYDSTREYTS